MNLPNSVQLTALYAVTAALLSQTVIGAQAATLVGPATATVNPGDVPTFWNLSQAATLKLNPGAQSQEIFAEASTVNLNGASSIANTGRVLELDQGALAMVVDSSLLNTADSGATVRRGSLLSLLNSQVTAVQRGLNLLAGGEVIARNTQVTVVGLGGTVPLVDGAGIVMLGGTVTLGEGSQVVGSSNGAVFSGDRFTPGDDGHVSTLIVDNSSVQSQFGSGIALVPLRGAELPVAQLLLRNGSTLSGGNGIAMDLAAGTTATVEVDASTVQGGINAASGAAANVVLNNGSRLTGNSAIAVLAALQLEVDNSTLSGDINLQEQSEAVLAFRNGAELQGSLNASNPTNTTLSLDGSTMQGNVSATGVTTRLDLSNASTLTGQVIGANQVTLDGGSVWNMTGSSRVGGLSINASRVNLAGTGGAFRTLTMDSLTGAGTFGLNTDIASGQGDLLVVTGQAEGSHSLQIANSGAEPQASNTGLVVVETGGGAATFAVAGGQVDAGTFVYELAHQGNDWALVRSTVGEPGKPEEPGGPGEPEVPGEPGEPGGPGEPEVPGEPEQPGGPGEPEVPGGPGEPEVPGEPEAPGEPGGPIVSPSARAVLGLFNAAPTVWYGETTTLLSRMGDLRTGRSISGPWLRAFGGRSDLSAAGGVAYRQRQRGMSFGVDTPLPAANGQWMLGVMGGYSRSDLDMAAGTNGHVDSYSLGVYTTWLSESGYYVDALIKANRFQNGSDVRMSDGQRTGGDYDTYGVGGSVEVGKHIKLADGWFVEPYAQLSALRVQGEKYDLDNGMQARGNHADSLLGKVGSHVGRQFALPGGGSVQPYIKIAAAHEFAKSNRVKINDTYSFNNDLSGSRGELGAGISAQLTEAFQLHADFDYSKGKSIEQPWGGSLGVRYAW
ncbi:autotransporter outer membrane beta-barrel domain-containing protein [Pseudomonas sp. RIT-PI-a]|uniref:autotransporter outer membrane beta-barrel domain-containing protein n=1 Tax=Pseudomonas sp. RIT-PI-a TaxID=1681194 RepID=UPI000675F785|nr:autotransporter outer membrane beta-barrel domain-containing protein [Pseudomonas sp. RIT-PI-a]